MTISLIQALVDGPVDVIGDVHGEIEPLRELLGQLGYDDKGRHPAGRRPVFVGDLCDRGPDSPAVVDLVRELVEEGRGQCVLGNHELNLLRRDGKEGNRWFVDPAHTEQQAAGKFAHSRAVPDSMTKEYFEFFSSLPLALEREDLRVVHAAWDEAAIRTLRGAKTSIVDLYHESERIIEEQLKATGLLEQAEEEKRQFHRVLEDRSANVELLRALGLCDERRQTYNPVRVVTSGIERLADKPFWASGKWRMCARVPWWNEYQEETPVIIGHYWRQLRPIEASDHAATKPEVFGEEAPTAWVGRDRKVFCVDYSVGVRYEERRAGITDHATHIAAMRWPEKELWLETGKA